MNPITHKFARFSALALALATCLAPALAAAQSARVLSFAGHRLMEDPTDVFMFPGLLFANSDRMHFDYEPTAQSGQGGLTFGESRIIGVHVGRGMVRHHPRSLIPAGSVTKSDYEDFAEVMVDQGGLQVISPPGMMLDVMFGLPSGLGFRLSVTNHIDDEIKTATPAPDPVPEDVCGTDETGTEFRTLEAGAGWSQRTADRSTDIGGAISLHTVKGVSRGCLDAEAVGSPSVAAAARIAFKMDERMELGVLGQVELRDRSMEFSRKKTESESSVMALTVGVGPRYALSDNVTAVATAVIGMSLASDKETKVQDAPATEDSSTTYILPGIDLALEAKWKDWLTARAGVLNRYTISTREKDDGALKTETVKTSSEHLAAAGVGIHWGRFTIDGAFNVPFLTSGPDFLGGQGTGLFSELSMAYAWGGPDESASAAPPMAPIRRERDYDGGGGRDYVPPSLPQQPTPRYEPPPTPRYDDPSWPPR